MQDDIVEDKNAGTFWWGSFSGANDLVPSDHHILLSTISCENLIHDARQPVRRLLKSLCRPLAKLDLAGRTRCWLFQYVLWNVPCDHKYSMAVRLRATAIWQKMQSLMHMSLQALREFCDMSWPSGHWGPRSSLLIRDVAKLSLWFYSRSRSDLRVDAPNSEHLEDTQQVSCRLWIEGENGLQMHWETHARDPKRLMFQLSWLSWWLSCCSANWFNLHGHVVIQNFRSQSGHHLYSQLTFAESCWPVAAAACHNLWHWELVHWHWDFDKARLWYRLANTEQHVCCTLMTFILLKNFSWNLRMFLAIYPAQISLFLQCNPKPHFYSTALLGQDALACQ